MIVCKHFCANPQKFQTLVPAKKIVTLRYDVNIEGEDSFVHTCSVDHSRVPILAVQRTMNVKSWRSESDANVLLYNQLKPYSVRNNRNSISLNDDNTSEYSKLYYITMHFLSGMASTTMTLQIKMYTMIGCLWDQSLSYRNYVW